MEQKTLDYTLDALRQILAIDSPTGFTDRAAAYVADLLRGMGYDPAFTKKGGVLCCLGGKDEDNGILLSVHIDTLGAVVAQVKGNGRLKLAPMSLSAHNTEAENVLVYTRTGKTVPGTIQLINPSVHVNPDYKTAARNFDTVECVLDEDVRSAEDVKALGIGTGCFVCPDPRTTITESGYIKSRFLDDKLSAAILLGLAQHIKESGITPQRKVWVHFTVYEEIGHGGSATMPAGVTEMLGIDMGCVGDGIACTEKQVSICAKDASGPYNFGMTNRLIALAEEKGIDHAVDVYPFYSSDCSAALRTYDVKAALIGPGVYASHGYERSHIDGVKNTFDLLCAYLEI
ncbi:MAG: M42 family metallopeptidase [Clostridia bacterium]|nr:M42 family metallopeptidase [Clostridia bacterium]